MSCFFTLLLNKLSKATHLFYFESIKALYFNFSKLNSFPYRFAFLKIFFIALRVFIFVLEFIF